MRWATDAILQSRDNWAEMRERRLATDLQLIAEWAEGCCRPIGPIVERGRSHDFSANQNYQLFTMQHLAIVDSAISVEWWKSYKKGYPLLKQNVPHDSVKLSGILKATI
jgi:hypothetical protein